MDDAFILSSPSLPDNPNNNPILSNSFIGHRLHSDAVYMNGLYNGYRKSCHRARIPCFIPYVRDPAYSAYELYLRYASYVATGDKFVQTFYAHSVLNRVFVTEIYVASGNVLLESKEGQPSCDLSVISHETECMEDVDMAFQNVRVFAAQINEPECESAPKLEVYCVRNVLPTKISAGKHLAITAFGYSRDEAVEFYTLAVKYHSDGILRSTHEKTWEHIWSTVDIKVTQVSDNALSATIASSLFYLLSAFPHFALNIPDLQNFPFQFFGVSPGSLGNGGKDQDYWGHVFWDQDLWMLPGVMLLFPELARQSILYRVAMLPGARAKARSNGYQGAMFPWESGRTGVDVCPGEIYAKYQQHITACVVFAIRQYVYVTGSWDILTTDGAWDLVKETADFWVSRVEWDGENFVINSVMDPDEYHYRVDNSCFTNAAARMNVLFAIEASGKLGKKPDPRWLAISKDEGGIKIPFDKKLRYHPEYDGYTPGTLIKQASVVLIGYPLGFKMDEDVRRNDIIQYEKCTDKGPGMTYSMYCIGMLELGKKVEADRLFKVQFKHLREPFRVWNEYPNAVGCTNFLTAVGGFIQSLLYGFLGVRVLVDELLIKPVPIADCENCSYIGISYCSERFDIAVFEKDFRICKRTENVQEIWNIHKGKEKWPLITNKQVSLPYGQYAIRRE